MCDATALPGLGRDTPTKTTQISPPTAFAGCVRHCMRRAQASKAGYISKVFLDSYKSPLSIILIDDLERVIDFVRTGPRFSNTVLQTLLVLLKKVGWQGVQ